MKKYLIPITLVVVTLVVVIAVLVTPGALASGMRGTIPPPIHDGPYTMLSPTVPIDQDLQERTLEIVKAEPMLEGLYTFAITDHVYQPPEHVVSVAALTNLTDETWTLDNAAWLGTVKITDQRTDPSMPGYVVITLDQITGNIGGGPGNILPFRNGTTAQYGILGVHDCGFGLTGWKAVDLFPSENMAFASLEGEVSYVCRDGIQMSVRIGQNLYAHLLDNGLSAGDHYSQGQEISSILTGTHSAPCGSTSQLENAYHVHFCFIPDNGGGFSADGYLLNVYNGNWTKGEETVSPLGWLTADWATGGDYMPGSTLGSNFWDSLIGNGVVTIIKKVLPILPEHESMDIAKNVLSVAVVAIEVVYVIALTNFDMTVPIWCLGIWFVMEAARIAYRTYMLVKNAIPIVG